MTEHQIRREARSIALELKTNQFVLAKRVKGRPEWEICLIDSLLTLYNIEKESLEKGFYIFYKREDKEERDKIIESAKRLIPEMEKNYKKNMKKVGWNIIYL